MKELNTDFYDEYKRLDKFCRDMFSGQDGVTEYIKQMENAALYRYYVPTWDEDLKQLKRMRHLRNKLAHEVEFDADLCTESDILFVKTFYTRLFNCSDPLSIIRRQKEAAKKDKENNKKHHRNSRDSLYIIQRKKNLYLIKFITFLKTVFQNSHYIKPLKMRLLFL